eukprot:m51a1_g3204 putative nucleoside 2-deoxyribosyltransferase (153) ;mRNA; f:18877-19335
MSARHQIYFCGSIRAGREDQPVYEAIVGHLERSFGPVLTAHVARRDVLDGQAAAHLSERDIYDRDVAWLGRCTAVVAEVTVPSLGVGFELGLAERLRKPTLCLWRRRPAGEGAERQKELSALVRGCPSFTVRDYETVAQAQSFIDQFFSTLE